MQRTQDISAFSLTCSFILYFKTKVHTIIQCFAMLLVSLSSYPITFHFIVIYCITDLVTSLRLLIPYSTTPLLPLCSVWFSELSLIGELSLTLSMLLFSMSAFYLPFKYGLGVWPQLLSDFPALGVEICYIYMTWRCVLSNRCQW